MTVKINGSLNLDRLAKALERIHEEQSGERVSISIRKMTDDERLEYQSKISRSESRNSARPTHLNKSC